MQPATPSRLLRAALLGNAAFSLVTGALLVLFATTIAGLVGPSVPPALFAVIGAGLIPFGLFVAWLGRQHRPDPWLAAWVSLADLGWVAGSLLVLLLARTPLSPAGLLLIAGVAASVLGFALGQLRGIGRVYASAPDKFGHPRYRVCVEVATTGRPEAIWRNLSDLGGISRFARMLAYSRLRDPALTGAGAIRECGDRSGRRWAELCRRFDPIKREIDADFMTGEPNFPFPFSTLSGGWSVQPAGNGGGAIVRVWLEGTPKPRFLAPLILPLLDWQSRRTFPATIQRLAEAPGAQAGELPALLSVVPC